jgi:SAM-dependent methyltransferase
MKLNQKLKYFHHIEEQLKPIPINPPKKKSILFYVRCLFDLQLKTITDFLRPELAKISNSVLDIGAGNAPWRYFLAKEVKYIGLDIEKANEFNMAQNNEIIYYSGGIFPFLESKFSHALCVEVLEHILDTETFLSEIYRCLAPNGKLILTVPWSARRHHLPYDYFRFTPEALEQLFRRQGFVDIEIDVRGNDFAVLFNKTLCLIQGLLWPKTKTKIALTLPVALIFLPSLLLLFLAAHLTMKLNIKSYFDPLGFSLTAKKPAINSNLDCFA